MGALSNFLEQEILDHVMMKGVYTPPGNIYIALSKANPGEDGAGLSEPSGGSYARKSTAAGDWDVWAAGVLDNANEIEFVEATGDWGIITHLALFDAVTSGNMLWYGALTASKTINTGDTFRIPAGDLDLTLD
jgi:hypothetical protein